MTGPGQQITETHRPAVESTREHALESIPYLELRAGAQRVAATWGRLGEASIEKEEFVELVAALGHAIAHRASGEDKPLDARLCSPVGRGTLELLRTEVVGWWRTAGMLPSSRDVVTLFAAFEDVRAAMDPDPEQALASRLSGADGLELVVEIAHDLRSPLTSVLFLAETLQRGLSGTVNDVQHRQLGLIYSAALGLSALASDVIELARGGNRLADDEPSPFSLTEILQSVHDIVRPMAEEKGLTVRFLAPEDDHRLGHPQALSRVLLNLTTNALKFTEEGFVEMVVQAKGPTTVEFSVRDTGRGIADAALKTLYLPFRRQTGREGYAFSGTGLGLSLCRKLVSAMGSKLEIQTAPNWGTRFYFELRLSHADQL